MDELQTLSDGVNEAGTEAVPADAPVIDANLTIHHAALLLPRLQAWLAAGCAPLSLAAAEECDCAGLQLLLSARRSAQAAGRALRLTDVGPAVRDALGRVGLASEFGL